MAYKLKFTQKFLQAKGKEFMKIEKEFIKLEEKYKEFPKGNRYIPYSAREPVNTLIWECEFSSLEEAQKTLDFLENDPRHEELFVQQVQYFIESYVEIYKLMEV